MSTANVAPGTSGSALRELTADELAQLDDCERVIAAGLTGFLEVADALHTVQEKRLYQNKYDNFDAYCWGKWGFTTRRSRQLIAAAKVARNVGTDVIQNERQARVIASEKPAEQLAIVADAAAANGGKLTTSALKKAKAKRAEPPVNPNTTVNGKAAPEPRDVAQLRKSGMIGADVKVSVTDHGAPDKPKQERDAGEDEVTDEDWVRRLPLWKQLSEKLRPEFEKDAIAFRHANDVEDPVMDSLRAFFRRENKGMKEKGLPPYMKRIQVLLKTPDPSDWKLCMSTQDGGCGGKGRTKFSMCPKCFGLGYVIIETRQVKAK